MKKTFQLIKELLTHVEQYEAEGNAVDAGMVHFVGWLNRKVGMAQPDYFVEYIAPDNENEIPETHTGTVLIMLITFLYRYAKLYAKKALEPSPLNTLDEYGFLATLIPQPSLTKSELIQQNLMEFTSGIEIIKRLRRNGFLEEFPDPNDGRSRRVKLTEEGKALFYGLKSDMDQVSRIVEADLADHEKGMLLPVLYRIHQFHNIIHHEDKKSTLGEIEGKYFNQES